MRWIFFFELTRSLASSDSIGEGWGYCPDYNQKRFKAELKNSESTELHFEFDSNYLVMGGIELYELYLKHIKVIPND